MVSALLLSISILAGDSLPLTRTLRMDSVRMVQQVPPGPGIFMLIGAVGGALTAAQVFGPVYTTIAGSSNSELQVLGLLTGVGVSMAIFGGGTFGGAMLDYKLSKYPRRVGAEIAVPIEFRNHHYRSAERRRLARIKAQGGRDPHVPADSSGTSRSTIDSSRGN